MEHQPRIERIVPLTALQEGLYVESLRHPGAGAYVVQIRLACEGELDLSVFREAIAHASRKFDVLRTVFVAQGKLRQVVLPERALPCTAEDISSFDEAARERRIVDTLEEQRRAGFDVGRDPLLRLHVFKLAPKRYTLVQTNHHLILDGWSMGLVWGEILAYYDARVAGRSLPESAFPPFARYVEWLQTRSTADAREYWSSELAGRPLQRRWARGSTQDYRRGIHVLRVASGRTNELRARAASYGTTLSALVLAAWSIVLRCHEDSDDVTLGAVVSGRAVDFEEISRIVGLCIQTVPIRVVAREATSLRDLARSVHQKVALAQRHGHLPLSEMKKAAPSDSKELFDHLFVFENYPLPDSVRHRQGEGIRLTLEDAIEQPHYDLNVVCSEHGDLEVRFLYNGAVLEASLIGELARHLQGVLEHLAGTSEATVGDAYPLTDGERRYLLEDMNATRSAYARESTLDSLVEEHATAVPDAIAIRSASRSLTYRELVEGSWTVSRALDGAARPGEPVALIVEPSPEALVTLLGILRAGCAYLPIDPEYPPDRVALILKDAGVRCALVSRRLASVLEAARFSGTTLELEDVLGRSRAPAPPRRHGAESAAYVLYTSGSTGVPKGVVVVHRNVVRLVTGLDYLPLRSGDTVLQTSSLAFDASTLEIWGALANGATIALVPRHAVLSATSLREAIAATGTTALWLTSPLFNRLTEEDPAIFPGVRRLLVGGDVVSPRHVAGVLANNPGLVVVNGYGPTENTTFSTVHVMSACDGAAAIPIGRPIRQSTAYVVDRHARLCPIGVAGELWVGGDGVAQGYLGKPELTRERFLPDPFVPGGRVYRTGDIARVLPDGTIQFLGRADRQVKIRGFRVELAEVERQMSRLEGLDECFVAVRGEGVESKVICAWYTSKNGLSPSAVREALKAHLPAWEVPTHLVAMGAFPLTANGKIDPHRLPDPERKQGGTGSAAATATEAALLPVWKEVLGLDDTDTGVDDDFFELGGHSLKLAELHARVSRVFGVSVPVSALFEAPTVRGLASRIDRTREAAREPLHEIASEALVPFSPAQKRLFIVDRLSGGMTLYNVTGGIRIEGVDVSKEDIECVFGAILERHHALRTALIFQDGVTEQRVHEVAHASVEFAECTEEEVAERMAAFVRPFDLEKPPLVRWMLLRTGEKRCVLISDAHHAVIDGWSVDVLSREVLALLAGRALPSQALQYRDFSEWQRRALAAGSFANQERWWLDELSGELPLLDLPADFPRPHERRFEGATRHFLIPAAAAGALRALARREEATLFMVLLAVYDALLLRYSGQDEVIVGIPVAARTHPDVGNVVGPFVNVLAIRAPLEASATFVEFLARVRAKCIAAYERQDVPFETIVERLKIANDPSHNPVFDTMFTLQAPFGEGELGGVRMSAIEFEPSSAKFDLTMIAREQGDAIDVAIEYSTDLFRADRIERMARHFVNLARAVCVDPETRVDRLALSSDEERELVVHGYNDRLSAAYSRDASVHSSFERIVRDHGERIALRFGEQSMSYRELDAESNRIARALVDRGVVRGDTVALLLERSPRMISAILAVVKAGAAYVPLDPAAPPKRLEYMLSDSGARVLITDSSIAGWLPFGKCLLLDVPGWETLDATPISVATEPNDLLQVMYTSGSTGKPKGVLVPHRSAVRIALNRSYLGIDPSDRVLQLSNYVFDGSTFDIFGALLNGATLVLVPELVLKDVHALGRLIRDEGVTVFFTTTALFNVLIDQALEDLTGVRAILFGGQMVSFAHSKKAFDALGPGRIVHVYGPTETAVYATYHRVDAIDEALGTVPIGVPIDHTRVYVVDRCFAAQPIGVAGEILIGGDAVTNGYLNRPDLTEAAFVPDPFVPGASVYRTGDVGCWLPDGSLRIFGRRDHQIKIRGLRVEIGEVETRLLAHPSIRAVHIATRDDSLGNKTLVGYYVATSQIPSTELRSFLAEELPEYMIPGAFVRLDELPLNRNGKVDGERLPPPTMHAVASAAMAPRTDIERKVAVIWAEVLDRETIGIRDGFFESGGNSLTLVNLHERLDAAFPGAGLRVLELFEHTTIEKVAALVEKRLAPSPDRSTDALETEDVVKGVGERATARRRARAHRRAASSMVDEEDA